MTDFSKAFDCVDHNIAIPKLIEMGTRPAAIPWIFDFLSNRSQCVRYHNVLSDWQNLSGGVPQGTLNGPIIFMVLANDAARMKDPNKLALKYVDDLTVIENVNTRNGSTIQSDLDNFDDWALCNNMKLNPTKCMYMDVSFMKDPQVLPPLRLCNQNLQSADVVKILGIKIAKDLTWDTHIGDVLGRASGRLFMLSRLKKFDLSVEDLVTIYVGFVRPLLEYAVPVWHSGLTEKQHQALERIQKRACRIILGGGYSSYQDALVVCNMPDLRSRRDKICLDFATKLYESQQFRSWLPKLRSEVVKVPLCNSNMMTLAKVRTQRYANSAIPYMVKKWNEQYKK